MGISKGKAAKKTTYKTKRHQFIAAWLRAPFKVGALMPSSRALARALAKRVDITRPGLVIELGAGTGVVTQALLEAGIAPKKLLVIEREPKLHSILEAQFPGLNIICGDAQHLSRVLDKLGNPPVNAIVSSLPMITLPKQVKHTIQQHMATLIADEGVIVQFTYGAQSPLNRSMLKKFGISGKRVRTVLTNVPPAHVWVYKKDMA